VPTPFCLLDLAERLLNHPALAPQPKQRLCDARAAFLFGNTAPDYVTVVGLPRQQGHFFDVPIRQSEPAYQRLLRLFPSLATPSQLPDDQAAFVAGYLAHLWLDQAWILGVFEPIFGPGVHRGSFKQRLLDHNLLRAYLDRDALRRLAPNVGTILATAQPRSWLPFAEDQALVAWRDHLAEQLSPGGHSRTIDVFARRHNLSPATFQRQLESHQTMNKAVFRHLSSGGLSALQGMWLGRSIELVNDYLSEGRLEARHVNQPLRTQLAPQPVHSGG
jgi:hypothetical protein